MHQGAAALHRELSSAGLLTKANEGEVAEQAKLAKLLVIFSHNACIMKDMYMYVDCIHAHVYQVRINRNATCTPGDPVEPDEPGAPGELMHKVS